KCKLIAANRPRWHLNVASKFIEPESMMNGENRIFSDASFQEEFFDPSCHVSTLFYKEVYIHRNYLIPFKNRYFSLTRIQISSSDSGSLFLYFPPKTSKCGRASKA